MTIGVLVDQQPMPVIGETGLAGQVRERLELSGFRMIELERIFGALGRISR